ncbi:hypothetical protein [Helicobacter sp. MIT 01-3238]|uniref:hypothetical protein n=1 Tax=Helicobacter sp. MIT 01-3238 TaxID=398627 RepID=UPI000E1EA1B5|nr:hypothetical protein [Helicobacter sp. MIT 01-3238]RDU54701.1 hypothetical protein CQA40_02445 [Helicobacter sp. MIT 01-3238]
MQYLTPKREGVLYTAILSQALLKNGPSHFLRYRATEWLTQTRDAHYSCACLCRSLKLLQHIFLSLICQINV